MQNLFYSIIDISIASVWLILAVVVLRVVLQNSPKWIRIIMWSLVAVRLVFPFKIESKIGIVRQVNIDGITTPKINVSKMPIPNTTTTPISPIAPSGISISEVLCVVWLVGIAGILVYLVVSYIRLKKKVNISITLNSRYRICDNIQTPFIFGIIKPKVYLPSIIDDEQLQYVIDHENSHLSHGDHIWKLLGFILLSLHWFNPFVFLAYFLFCNDIELSCDERVIKQKNAEYKRLYSEALLVCSTTYKKFSSWRIAFGEISVKSRIENVVKYKKPTMILVLVSLVATASLLLLFLRAPLVSAETNSINLNNTINNSESDVYMSHGYGFIYYYKEPINENNQNLYEQLNFASKTKLEHNEYEKLMLILETAKWVDNRTVDRLAFNFDGCIDCGYRVYFSLKQKIFLYENYFCAMSDEIYEMLKCLK